MRVQGVGRPLRYYLFKRKPAHKFVDGEWINWQWERYHDYTDPVKLPPWLTDPAPGYATALSQDTEEYDYIAGDGDKNIEAWIDRAAASGPPNSDGITSQTRRTVVGCHLALPHLPSTARLATMPLLSLARPGTCA
jgi:hypothetical protein